MLLDAITYVYLITGVFFFITAAILLYRFVLLNVYLAHFIISTPILLYCPLAGLTIFLCYQLKRIIQKLRDPNYGVKEHSRVLVMGAGFSGLCMAAKLQEAGVPFLMLEAYKRIGATFRHIRRGCDCDVMPAQYQFSFFQDNNWDRLENPSTEIKNYLTSFVKQYKLCTKIKFQTEVRSAKWDEQESLWKVETNNGIYTCDILISACGMLHKPKLQSRTSLNKSPIPYIKGIDSFGGKSFLSTRWDQNVNVQGARVAVVGSASASLQIVPSIVLRAKQIFVFQTDSTSFISTLSNSLKRYFPALVRFFQGLILFWEDLLENMSLKNWLLFKIAENLLDRSLRYQYQFETRRSSRLSVIWDIDECSENDECSSDMEDDFEKKVIPKYSLGSKTLLQGNEFVPQLNNSNNIHIISDPILEITEDGVRTKDGDTQVDVIVYATGGTDAHADNLNYQLVGRNGVMMREQFQEWTAYLGMTMPNFPNLFLLLGPNTVLSHHLFIFMIESQVNYVVKVLEKMASVGIVSVEPSREATSQYHRKMTIWTKSQTPNICQGWYRTQETDKYSIWPKHLIEYWFLQRNRNLLHEYEIIFEDAEAKNKYY